jgi:hypothetical protein
MFLDSGASRHVGPLTGEIDNVTTVNQPHTIIDATDNHTHIQIQGDLDHVCGGKVVTFKNLLLTDKVPDTLISVTEWLKGTEDRIILTKDAAFHQAAGSNERHQIARVIKGMYHMMPLAKMDNKPQSASAKMIRSAISKENSGILVQKLEGTSYSKPRILAETVKTKSEVLVGT